MIELGGGYAEGAEELYVQRLEAARKKDQHRQRQPHHNNHQDHNNHHNNHHEQQNHHQNHNQQNHHQNHNQQDHHNQHHERQDHLSSFVDLDFEHFVPGHVEDIEPPRPTKSRVIQNTHHHNNHHNNRNHNHNQHPGNFSVLVSGLAKNPNPKELAKLFKEGAVDEDKHKAFITG